MINQTQFLKPGLLTLLLLVALAFPARPQAPDWGWAKSAGGRGFDYSQSVATDANGNVFVTGNFGSLSLKFGTTTLTNVSPTESIDDMFLVKYDGNGNVLWAKSAGGTVSDYGKSVATDSYGNVFVTGNFDSPTLTFGTITLTNAGIHDIFIVKYDGSGNVLWAKSEGGALQDYGKSVVTDINGSVFVTGYFFSPTLTIGTTTLTNAGDVDMFILKYDGNGNVLWAESAGGLSKDHGESVATDFNGNVFVTGYFSNSTLTFGTTTLTIAGGSAMFIVKYDGNGNVLWAKSAGGTSVNEGYSVATDNNGNVFVTGYFESPIITFETTTLTNSGSYDMFIVKYDGSGNVLWAKSAHGTSMDGGSILVTNNTGNVFVTGWFYSPTLTFGTTTLKNADATVNTTDIFVVKYDGNGNVLWAKSAGGKDWDWGTSVAIGANRSVFITGEYYSSALIFGSTILSKVAYYDIFIAKLSDHGTSGLTFNDLNSNCLKDTNELGIIPNITLLINPGNVVTQTNNDGTWYLDSLPAGNYTVTTHPTGKWQLTCPESQNFSVTDPNAFTVAPAFGFVSTEPCPEPDVSVNAPFLRRCFSNQNIYVNACNKTTATGTLNNAYLILKLDSFLIPQSSSMPYTDLGNKTFRFDVGNLNPGICTKFSIACSVSCNTMMGQTLCVKANLYPADSCVFDTVVNIPTGVTPCTLPWDKSSLKVEGSCVDDTIGFKAIRFVVYNTGKAGEGNMQCYSPVRIYVDAQMFKLDSVKLNGGDSIVYTFAGDGKTWRLEADQHPKHPGHSHPNVTIEACGETINWTPGLVNALPMDDADPVVDIYCGTVTTSYDPNDKAGYPAGIGENNDIMPNQKIEYVIRFQNTGNDTAFTIVVRDTLNMALDIFSVTSGASSHNYSFRMYGPRILEWTFNNILLPDSNVNEPGSHGFLTFSVSQVSALSNETKIKNTADIYFDFNAPVRTNTVTHTVQDNVQNIPVSSKKINLTKANTIKIYPNPAGGKLLVEIPVNQTESVTISIHDLVGKKLMQWKETVTLNYKKEIDLRTIPAGVYFLKVQGGDGVEVRKVVVY